MSPIEAAVPQEATTEQWEQQPETELWEDPDIESAPIEVFTRVRVPELIEAHDFERVLETMQVGAQQLEARDALSLKQCAAAVTICKTVVKTVEERRKALVDPLNKQVDEYNAIWMPFTKGFKACQSALEEKIGTYQARVQRELEEAQRKAEAEAAAKQAELDRKAEEARKAAEEALAKGDTVKAAKLEGKANDLAIRAAEVVPVITQQLNKKVDLGGGQSLSLGTPKTTWNLTGWDKKKPLPVMSPLLTSLVGDIAALPPNIQWILRHADLNPVYLNNSSKVPGAAFPKPFTTVPVFGGSRLSS